MYGQPSYNPFNPQLYQPQYNPFPVQPQQPATRYEIIRVNGENGAEALQMAPNSSLFVADETKPDRIWLLMTDGAGYKTKRAIKAVFEDVAEKNNIELMMVSFDERLKALEEARNEQLNTRNVKSKQTRSNVGDNTES